MTPGCGWRATGRIDGPRPRRIASDTFPWLAGRLLSLETVIIADVERLPDEASAERAELRGDGVRAMLCMPMYYGGQLFGFLRFLLPALAIPFDRSAEVVNVV